MTRDEFMNVVYEELYNDKDNSRANRIIDAADSYAEENKPHWIPCSERLPEVKQKVLVQYADGSMATKRCNDVGHLAWFYSNAVAWAPAPEPWFNEERLIQYIIRKGKN